MIYDYLIVGAGLYGATFAQQMKSKGKSVLVMDKRNHIGGNVYTEYVDGIMVHKYGPHIFHTDNKVVWDYVNNFATFNGFINSPIASYEGELYSLPFNMYTFNKLWGVNSPNMAALIIEQQAKGFEGKPENLEEQAISLVGRDIYEKLIKGYTEKQWGRPCTELPPSIIKRLPVRFTFNNNYYNTLYQGIPVDGYTAMISKMLKGNEFVLNQDYLKNKEYWNKKARRVVYTGPVDAYFDYIFGPLEYRSLRFVQELCYVSNFQGNAVVNYTSKKIPWTRIIEHKWFMPDSNFISHTIVTKEFSREYKPGENEPYYPINDTKNNELYKKYQELADKETNVIFGGRLAEYKYYDMDQVIMKALRSATIEGMMYG